MPPAHGQVKSNDGSYGLTIYIHLSDRRSVEHSNPSGELLIHVGRDLDGLSAQYRQRGTHIVVEPVSQPCGLKELVVLEANRHWLPFAGKRKRVWASTRQRYRLKTVAAKNRAGSRACPRQTFGR